MIKTVKQKLKSLDIHTLEVVKKSSSSLIVKVVGMAAGLITSIILGRTLGPEGIGIINLSTRLIGFVLVFAMLGMDNVLRKEIAIAFEEKDWKHIADVMFTSVRIIIPVALLLSFILIILAPWLTSNIFHEPKLKIPLIVFSALLIPQVLSRIFAAGLNGFRKIWQSNLVGDTLSSALTAIGLVIMWFVNIDISLNNVVILYGIARVIVTIVTGAYWRQLFNFRGRSTLQINSMLSMGLPLLLVSASSLVSSNSDIIMLGWLGNTNEVGLYSIAARLALLTSFFHMLTVSSLTPKIAALYSQERFKELKKMIQQVTKVLGFIGLLSLVTFLFAGRFLLELWGPEFTVAYVTLIIISIGQFFNISTGATGVLLIMAGKEKIVGNISLISAVLNLIMNFILIPKYGALGAAIATALTISTSNIIKVFYAYKKLGIMTLPFVKL